MLINIDVIQLINTELKYYYIIIKILLYNNNILIIIGIKNWRSDCTPSDRDCENWMI